MKSQSFAKRLNCLLDRYDFPKEMQDREIVFCEYFNIPQPKAKMILDGTLLPRKSIIERIAEELFVEEAVLSA
jgi:hypothetical protein